MGDKAKPICKWKKTQYVKDLAKLKSVVKNPRYVCRDCGRVANEKKWLCEPVKL